MSFSKELLDKSEKVVWNCVNLKDRVTNGDRKK